jgi:hypothetical protein
MPIRSLKQGSFYDPRLAAPGCLVEGTVAWLLGNWRDVICPPWLLAGWRGSGRRGRCAWPAPLLMTLLVLRWVDEGTSRIGSMRRAASDIVWRAAMGLVIGGPTPSERTMRDFEAFLRERDPGSDLPRYLLVHEHIVHLARWSGSAADPTWAMDSTPQYCYGAVLDTVRLLGDGLGLVATAYSSATGTPLLVVARRWKLPLLLAKSTKGHLDIDWRDRDARSRVITELAADVTRVVGLVRADLGAIKDGPRRRALISRCDAVLAVVEQDLETSAEGRLVIAQRVAQNRVISITDPEARHGRKSKSQTFNGFKINVLGDIVSGLITAVSVTAGNGHDAPPGHELIARARRLRVDMKAVLADTAYGGAADRHQLSVMHGIALIAPPPPVSKRGDAIERREFEIDFAAMTATCPNGATTDVVERVEDHAEPHLRFRWPVEACADCPLAQNCLRPKRDRSPSGEDAPDQPVKPIQRRNRARTTGRVLNLHPHEEELRAARAAWADPEVRRMYRDRTQCERLVAQVIRHGGRQARAWGAESANLQVHAIVMRCNLEILAKNLVKTMNEATTLRRAA